MATFFTTAQAETLRARGIHVNAENIIANTEDISGLDASSSSSDFSEAFPVVAIPPPESEEARSRRTALPLPEAENLLSQMLSTENAPVFPGDRRAYQHGIFLSLEGCDAIADGNCGEWKLTGKLCGSGLYGNGFPTRFLQTALQLPRGRTTITGESGSSLTVQSLTAAGTPVFSGDHQNLPGRICAEMPIFAVLSMNDCSFSVTPEAAETFEMERRETLKNRAVALSPLLAAGAAAIRLRTLLGTEFSVGRLPDGEETLTLEMLPPEPGVAPEYRDFHFLLKGRSRNESSLAGRLGTLLAKLPDFPDVLVNVGENTHVKIAAFRSESTPEWKLEKLRNLRFHSFELSLCERIDLTQSTVNAQDENAVNQRFDSIPETLSPQIVLLAAICWMNAQEAMAGEVLYAGSLPPERMGMTLSVIAEMLPPADGFREFELRFAARSIDGDKLQEIVSALFSLLPMEEFALTLPGGTRWQFAYLTAASAPTFLSGNAGTQSWMETEFRLYAGIRPGNCQIAEETSPAALPEPPNLDFGQLESQLLEWFDRELLSQYGFSIARGRLPVPQLANAPESCAMLRLLSMTGGNAGNGRQLHFELLLQSANREKLLSCVSDVEKILSIPDFLPDAGFASVEKEKRTFSSIVTAGHFQYQAQLLLCIRI